MANCCFLKLQVRSVTACFFLTGLNKNERIIGLADRG
mgnify:CR=1 FL=1